MISDVFDVIGGLIDAAGDQSIVNVSFGARFPIGTGWLATPIDIATGIFTLAGGLIFASAGNSGADVDAEDCFGWCWEEAYHVPCESPGVTCVGGMTTNTRNRHANSNYGVDDCGSVLCDVEIFGPFTVFTGSDPDNPANATRSINGTSFASPFVAGVAALVWAADPGLSGDDVRDALLNTAHWSPDNRVSRVIDAEAAVRSVLGPTAPVVDILSPDPGVIPYGRGFDLRSADFDSASGCCQRLWTDSIEGVVTNSGGGSYAFRQPGQHVLTLTVTDADGNTASDSVTLTATNAPPDPQIIGTQTSAFRNVAHTLRGQVTDENQGFIPCSAFTWTSSDPADTAFPVTGCQPSPTFTTVGPRTVTLTVTDDFGMTGTEAITITVTDPPDAHAPFVTITNPGEFDSPNPNEPLTLSASVTQAANGGAATYQWRSRFNGTDTVLGTTNPLTWTPSSTYPYVGCDSYYPVDLFLDVTDAWGPGQDTVHIIINYGTC